MVKPSRDRSVVRAIDERNIAGIALIPSQKYLPKTKLVWTRNIATPTGRMLTVTCKGMPDIGLPRGVDGDILVSLLNAYVEAGCPTDGVIVASPYAILKGPGLAVTSEYYQLLGDSLARLKTATFTVTDGWFEAHEKRYTSAHFSLLTDVEYTHGEHGMDDRSIVRLQLSDRITKSVREGYIKPLNLTLYRKLPSIGARTLYRLLDLYLFEAAERGEGEPYHLTVPLVNWGAHCGILDSGPDKIKRALDAMHRPLLAEGYLSSVSYTGAGRKTEVLYVYGQASAPAKPEHVEALMRYRIHKTQAEKYARELGEGVFAVVAAFEEHKRGARSKVENEARYLMAMLKNAESVLSDAKARDDADAARERALEAKARSARREEVAREEADARDREDVFARRSPSEAAEYIFGTFNTGVLTRTKAGAALSVEEVDRLKHGVARGHLDPHDVYGSVVKAIVGGAGRVEAIAALRDLAARDLS